MDAKEFVKAVFDAYQNKKGIFKNRLNAEDLLPKNITAKQKALFLFYIIQLDYATKSQKLYEGAKKLFKIQPQFFNSKHIKSLTHIKLAKTVQKYLKPRYLNEAIRRYQKNSLLLEENYDGDPRKIFKRAHTAKEALGFVREFRGFGPKIGNFFVRVMVNTFHYQYEDIADILPPVDVHDVRIAYLLGFIDSKEMTSKNIAKTKRLWNKACKDADVSWLVNDKALWLLGSEGKPKTKNDILKLLSN